MGAVLLVVLLLPVAAAVAAGVLVRRRRRPALEVAALALLAFLATTVALRLAFTRL